MEEIRRTLNKYQNELKALEKEKDKLTGSNDSLFQELKKELGDISMTDIEAINKSKIKIKELKDKMQKAEKQLSEKIKEIEEIMDGIDD